MKTLIAKKSLFSLALSLVILVFLIVSPVALAKDHHNNHKHDNNRSSKSKIISIGSISANSATLSLRFRSHKNETVAAVISIKNESTDMIVQKIVNAKLNGDGKGSAVINGLREGTRYTFKAHVLKSGDEDQAKDSNSKTIKTASI
jgi:hypothetical protein